MSITIQLPRAEATFTDDAVAIMLGHHPPKQFDLEDLSGLFSANMLNVLVKNLVGLYTGTLGLPLFDSD